MNRKVCPCNAENWRIPADFSITHLMGYKQERANLACKLWTQTIKGEKQGYQIGYFLRHSAKLSHIVKMRLFVVSSNTVVGLQLGI